MKGAALAKALDAPDPATRCYLFYGADEAGSRALAARLAIALGTDAERVEFGPAQLRADPALLADEAASASLFGSRRYIRIDGAGDESVAAVETLLNAPVAGNPVLLVAGALRKDARLVKLVDGSACGIAVASYEPEGAAADRLAVTMARDAGLIVDEEMGARLIALADGDRSVLASELAKLALYVDASPASPVRLSPDAVDAVAAGSGDADPSTIVDAVFAGDVRRLDRELARASSGSEVGVPVVRALLRRTLAMAAIRADIDRGTPTRAAIDRGGRSLFWRDREAVGRDIARWTAASLATTIARLATHERDLKSSTGIGELAMRRTLLALTRAASRRR